LGLAVWTEDEAGPYATRPYPGRSWGEAGQAKRQPHEYQRAGTAKLMSLFCPASGEIRAKGAKRVPNQVLHPWLQMELADILSDLPATAPLDPVLNRAVWQSWQAGLQRPITLPAQLPPLRLLLILDNLTGHRSAAFVLWLFRHGVMPLYTPLGGSWLNMAESAQRIIKDRALAGQYPQTAEEIMDRLEATVRGWNQAPTPFHWGGRRQRRRQRSRERRHALAGSGACTTQTLPRGPPLRVRI
jgi:hypothetical protein